MSNIKEVLEMMLGSCAIYDIRPECILNSREISFAHNFFSNRQIVFEILYITRQYHLRCCLSFQNDLTTETDNLDEGDFARFGFKMSFGRISHIA